MADFKKKCDNTILKVQELLAQNPEWIDRYEKYANKISDNLIKIEGMKKNFHEWASLYLYMNVTEAKGSMKFSLRHLGQNVAKLKVGKDKITISTKDFDDENKTDFGCTTQLRDCEWRSDEAKQFRKHFSKCPKRNDKSRKGNEEHRIESLLLTEFSKKSSKDKKFYNIQPVKLADIARFQMPTPLRASNMTKLKYSRQYGGGIDILARVGRGKATRLCIVEIKVKNEPTVKVIQQGLAYATFVRELLKSKSGQTWWKIFNFKRKLPKQIELCVACAMPSGNNDDRSFGRKVLANNQGKFYLHYIYFEETDNKIVNIETSL